MKAVKYIGDGTRRSEGPFYVTSLETVPGDFVYIPEAGAYVATSKARGYEEHNNRPDGDDSLAELSGFTSFHFLISAWRRHIDVVSSSDWGKSVKYFQENAEKDFGGISGEKIIKGYTHGSSENTSTFLAYRDNGDFPEEVRDLLFRFRGDIALIDYPVPAMDNEGFLLDNGPRTRIVDVTDIIPRESAKGEGITDYGFGWVRGFVNGIDEELGIPVSLGPEPNSLYGGESGAFCWIKPKGLRRVIRGTHMWISYEGKLSSFEAIHGPFEQSMDIGMRLSSIEDPKEALSREPKGMNKYINKKSK